MGKVAILLASHGEFAKAALESAEMIIGKQENFGIFSLSLNDNLDSAVKKMETVYQSLDTTRGTLVLTDIYGGTPNNVATTLLQKKDPVQIFSGLNLPLLLEIGANRGQSLAALTTLVETIFPQTQLNVNEMMKGMEADGDSLD